VSRSKKKQARKAETSLKARRLTWYSSQAPVIHFGLKFGLSLALFYVLLSTPIFDHALYAYLKANAWLANAILRALGQATHVSEVTIQSPLFSMRIQRGCDAVEPTWLVCAAMLSFPAPFIHKIRGMLAAIVLLQVMNLVRIITLYLIAIRFPGLFNSAHEELWPTVFIIVAIAFFVGWKEYSPRLQPNVPN
jgi:exosortase/archaeosortase family protein